MRTPWKAHEFAGVRRVHDELFCDAVAIDDELLRPVVPVRECREQCLVRLQDLMSAVDRSEDRTDDRAGVRVTTGQRLGVAGDPFLLLKGEEPDGISVRHRGTP
jgi:hypothetical protein